MDLVTLITVKLTATEVGRDSFGNRYYEERQARPGKPPRRYVRYNGMIEASKVPADWHGWLHHTELSPPPEGGYAQHEWQREHQPNTTGTSYAHRPIGHLLKGGKRAEETDGHQQIRVARQRYLGVQVRHGKHHVGGCKRHRSAGSGEFRLAVKYDAKGKPHEGPEDVDQAVIPAAYRCGGECL